MLESEAKTKWCPMYRDSGEWGTNRNYQSRNEDSSCLANQCACWVDDGHNDKAGEREGHCGLAR